jgi:hypothetical protein
METMKFSFIRTLVLPCLNDKTAPMLVRCSSLEVLHAGTISRAGHLKTVLSIKTLKELDIQLVFYSLDYEISVDLPNLETLRYCGHPFASLLNLFPTATPDLEEFECAFDLPGNGFFLHEVGQLSKDLLAEISTYRVVGPANADNFNLFCSHLALREGFWPCKIIVETEDLSRDDSVLLVEALRRLHLDDDPIEKVELASISTSALASVGFPIAQTIIITEAKLGVPDDGWFGALVRNMLAFRGSLKFKAIVDYEGEGGEDEQKYNREYNFWCGWTDSRGRGGRAISLMKKKA